MADRDPVQPVELDTLLRLEAARRPPEPTADLVERSLVRVRRWILLGDLLRFAVFEGLWSGNGSGERDADAMRARQDRGAGSGRRDGPGAGPAAPTGSGDGAHDGSGRESGDE